MQETRTGWRATRADGETWYVPGDDEEPNAIYVYWGGSYLTMQYGGVDGSERMLKLPPDPHLLRDLADVLHAAADRCGTGR